MNVSLSDELEKFIQEKVQSGFYNSSSEVVREALRLLAREDEKRTAKINMLNNEINKGLESAKKGETFKQEEVYKNLTNKRDD